MSSYSVYSIQGKRPYQEDCYSIGEFLNFGNKVKFFAVYDGHGGAACSEWLTFNLLNLFQSNFSHKKLTRSNITQFISNVDYSLRDEDIQDSGSTTIIVLICFDKTILINLGDSHALCYSGTNIIKSTIEHTISNDFPRISKTDAFFTNNNKYLINPVNYSQIGVARAFGDFDFKERFPYYVDNTPDVYKIPLLYNKYKIVLASDGVWDVFSDINTIQFLNNIEKNKNVNLSLNGAELLVQTAYNSGSTDNITAIVIINE